MSRKHWLAAALVAAAAIGAAFWLQPPPGSDLQGTRDSPAATEQRSDVIADAGAGAAGTRNPPAAVNRHSGLPTDPFEYIRGLARRAYDGDGEAQYLIARELNRCDWILSLVRKESDPETAILSLAAWPPGMRQWGVSEFRRCARLRDETPFVDLPDPPPTYTRDYWYGRAGDSGYPLAVVQRSLLTLMRTDEHSAEARASAKNDLASAAASDVPDALLQMGHFLYTLSDAAKVNRGAALMLAACRVGADCSPTSPVVPVSMCHDMGDPECPPGTDVETMLRFGLAPDQFAQAYAESQQIEYDLRSRDSARIKPWLDLF